ncbi:MAG: hypothetical protein IT369_02640 [Candidatus Latescibacteria bacterium]|nr:hypothetical protein [Candidatus Latescibacterota bacterium]
MAPPVQHPLVAIDCTRTYPANQYFACGETEVVASPLGAYRQAEARPLARFGYRFTLPHPGRPHLLRVWYPDDQRRFMLIMDGTGYDLSTGILTGGAQPLSGQLLESRQVFWPRWQDCSLVFTTWSTGEPAAVARFEICELEDLPALEIPGDPGDHTRRQLGIQYEDPCGTAASEGALSKEEWAERVTAYMRHSGQRLLVYPLVWYHGPQYPSEREPADAFDVVVAPDRRQYIRWTTKPPEWITPLLQRFGEQGLQFQASLTLLRLGSLMKQMNTDLQAIAGGAPTINNMLVDNQVQRGTSDWTPVYNARNYAQLLEYYAAEKDMGDFPWAYGEQGGQHPGPLFNPLHPVVQEAAVGLVEEIARRYAAYPAFTGICLNFWHATFLWFGSLRAGYDDYTCTLFSAQTGIEIPVDATAPDRFARRSDYLNRVCPQVWINWRCQQLHQLVCRLRDALVAARPDLTLTLTLWDETTVPQLLGWTTPGHQLGARPSTAQLYREGGLDLDLYRNEPGLALDLGMGNSRDRGGHPPASTDGTEAPLYTTAMYRDHDFLDQQTLDAVAAQAQPGAFLFNCWVEAWGHHRWFPCEPGDTQAAGLAQLSGQPAEGIFRINSEYPPDGFWWDSQLRITPAFPAGVHFMEPYAHALAELDACRLTRGGLFLDKAHTEELQRFARAFCALPRQRFHTVSNRTDPVALRQLLHEGRYYCYLVNREYYPVQVEVEFNRLGAEVCDLAEHHTFSAPWRWQLTLGPYELRAFTFPAHTWVHTFAALAPPAIIQALQAEVQQALADLEQAEARDHFIPGAATLRQGIERALSEGRLAWLRRALYSYPMRRCRQLLEAN